MALQRESDGRRTERYEVLELSTCKLVDLRLLIARRARSTQAIASVVWPSLEPDPNPGITPR